MASKKIKLICILLVILTLIACGEETVILFDNLSERDANEIAAALLQKGIEAKKIAHKKGISVVIKENDMARSVSTLKSAGLPNRTQTSLGDIFKKEGVISTPLEERARYIYALSQELEYTLSQIDDVLVARVHIVLPERVAPGQPISPSSAAVFIKHFRSLDPDVIEARIKRLVASSIPGLSEGKEDKISVSFIENKDDNKCMALRKVGPFIVAEQSAASLRNIIRAGIVTSITLLILLLILSNTKTKKWVTGFIFRRQATNQ